MSDFEEKPMTADELKELWFGVEILMHNRVRHDEHFANKKRQQLEETQFIREHLICVVAEAEKEAGETSDQREASMIMLRASAKIWEMVGTGVWDYVQWYAMLTKHNLDRDVVGELSEEERAPLKLNNGEYYRLTDFGRLFLDDDRITLKDFTRLCAQRVDDKPFNYAAILCQDSDTALAYVQRDRDHHYFLNRNWND